MCADLRTVMEKLSRDYQCTLLEYFRLASKSELSAQDADRLDEILAEAESDALLCFFLNEIDYLVGQKLGLRNDDHVGKYRDQKAWMREYLKLLRPEELELHRELQKLLQERGYYKGPTDGVFGKYSLTAVENFQMSHHLKVDGIVGPQTILQLTSNSQTVVRFARMELELANLSPPGG